MVTNGNGNGTHNSIYAMGVGGVGTAVSYMERNRKTREGEPVAEERQGDARHTGAEHNDTDKGQQDHDRDVAEDTCFWISARMPAQKKVTLQIVGEFEKG